ncbi:serine hydrolase domain-containing protein [Microbacterium sp. AGC85]
MNQRMAHTKFDQYNEAIEEALAESLFRGETGIQAAGYVNGELAFNASAGVLDKDTRDPVTNSSLFCPFSVTKAVTVTALHVQAARGLVDYRRPVADYWPEFGNRGKGDITVRDVLSHRAGIPWMPDGITPELQADWAWMVRQIEQSEPVFPAGTVNCYHALNWGWIVGEIVRRIDGKDRGFDVIIQDTVLGPLGIEDLYFGVPESQRELIATLYGGEPPATATPDFLQGMPRAVYPSARVYNLPVSIGAVNPGAGSFGTAESYARVFGMLANRGELDGVRLFDHDEIEQFLEPRDSTEDVDVYLGVPSWVGAFGYHLAGHTPWAHPLLGESDQILHHPGAGYSLAWAEIDTGLSVAITHNQMASGAPTDWKEHPYYPIVQAARAIRDDVRDRVSVRRA